MEHNLEELANVCIDAVKLANRTIENLGAIGISRVKIPGKEEIVTKADLAVSEEWRKYFSEQNVPIIVLTEESREIPFERKEDAKYLGVGDEIDGTFNFNRARGILPNCAIFTIFDSLEPRFEDALVTAVFEHNSGNLWYAIKEKGCYFNGKKVNTSGIKTLDKNTSIMIDRGPCPSPEHSLRYFNLDTKCWPRNISCAGVSLAGVASGSISGWDAYVLMIQKPEELASGYLLIKEAGGVLIDADGGLIGEKSFDWNRTYEIIAAATPELGEEIRGEILPIKEARKLYERMQHVLDFPV